MTQDSSKVPPESYFEEQAALQLLVPRAKVLAALADAYGAGPAAPVLFVSPEQLSEHSDPDAEHGGTPHGRYLPARKTPAGQFTLPLYALPPAAPAAGPALTPVERQALEGLCAVAAAAHHVADDSPYDGATVAVEYGDMEALGRALDKLEGLPDDQPGSLMGPVLKAEWALRRLLDAAPQEPAAPMSSADAMAVLKAAFAADPEYAWSWHCAVWACAHDEGLATDAANRAAARLMYMAFGCDTSKNQHFCDEHRVAAPAASTIPQWIDDPHDIEQGQMLNPAWAQAQAAPAPTPGMTPRNRETQDQIASVMLQHGTPQQQSQALAYASGAAPAAHASDTALLDAMTQHRIALVPENEGPWDAEVYGDTEATPAARGTGATPREALTAALATIPEAMAALSPAIQGQDGGST